MYRFPLQIQQGHMFIRIDDETMLLDTGAPNSFCSSSQLTLGGQQFLLRDNYLGLTPDTLSNYVGINTTGLIGADVLGVFDLIIDAPGSTVTLSTEKLKCAGHPVPLDSFMGIPIIFAIIGSATYRMFFDTGAQISYLQDDSLTDYPLAGQVKDFYPGLGQFVTETHTVDLKVGECTFSLRCGRLPDLLGMTLMMAGTQGILGNQFLHDRTVGYFPRRKILIL
jgi:hypothetical protein